MGLRIHLPLGIHGTFGPISFPKPNQPIMAGSLLLAKASGFILILLANPYSYSINLCKGSPIAALQIAMNRDIEGISFIDSLDLLIPGPSDAAVFHIVEDKQIGNIAPNQKEAFLSLI